MLNLLAPSVGCWERSGAGPVAQQVHPTLQPCCLRGARPLSCWAGCLTAPSGVHTSTAPSLQNCPQEEALGPHQFSPAWVSGDLGCTLEPPARWKVVEEASAPWGPHTRLPRGSPGASPGQQTYEHLAWSSGSRGALPRCRLRSREPGGAQPPRGCQASLNREGQEPR